ncbi:Serine/arginine-rich splicing factor 3 [Mizuhopecten yessoensis]|uniref:Serine/arginine-rich splicing factor 3 n=2 Tax=Mizuhopecten yessoensis TaxID=6573 RepID=A0A210QAE4_MIZYE|nr:Serine/arginine-rich splicing factor 3 [Mizuhopecten yessoensis]
MPRTKVYVGGLVDDVGNDRLHRTFEKFGKIKKVWVARNPGSRGYAFIDFYDPEHALNASVEMNGKHLFGSNLKVELSNNGIGDFNISERHRSDRHHDDRRAVRDYDDRRGDRDRDRRRVDRDHDYRSRRSPPSYYKSRSTDEDDDDSRLLSHVDPTALPRTINVLKQLERVTRLRLERELLEKFRRSSEVLSDIDTKDKLCYLSRDFEESKHIPYSSRKREPVNGDPLLTSTDPVFRDHHIPPLENERPILIDPKPDTFYTQFSNNPRGHSRSLLPTPDYPKLKNSENYPSFHGNPHIPPWHNPNEYIRTPMYRRPRPYGHVRKYNGDYHNDWYGKQYSGFGFLPNSTRSSANKEPNTPHFKLVPPEAPPAKEPESSDIVNTS